MSKRRGSQIVGRWISGPNAGRPVIMREVLAGTVSGLHPDGTRAFGSPDELQAETGETGERLLEMLLPRPTYLQLYEGMIRNALGDVAAKAHIGPVEWRLWEKSNSYLVNDGEGDGAVVQLVPGGVVGAMVSHDNVRSIDLRADLVPAPQRVVLAGLLELPFLLSVASGITAVFWTQDGYLESGEPWHQTYFFGGEILRNELLDEEAWLVEGAEYYDLTAEVASAIVAITKRAKPLQRITLTEEEIDLLLPATAPHRQMAAEELFSGGVFVPPSGRAP